MARNVRTAANEHGVTDMMEAFCQAYVDNPNDPNGAMLKAGYSKRMASQHAQNMLRNPRVQHRIHVLTREKIGTKGSWAFDQMCHLAASARSDFVKFSALKDIMDRAGFKPVDVSLNLKGDQTQDEAAIVERIATLMGGLLQHQDNPAVQKVLARFKPDPEVIDAKAEKIA